MEFTNHNTSYEDILFKGMIQRRYYYNRLIVHRLKKSFFKGDVVHHNKFLIAVFIVSLAATGFAQTRNVKVNGA